MTTEDCMAGPPILDRVRRRCTFNRRLILAGIVAVASLSPVFFGPLPSSGAEDVPPSPRQPWYPGKLRDYEAELAREARQNKEEASGVKADPNIVYDLPALIDMAQRSNPQTRIAWERARRAAAAVGLSQSAYFPYLVASARPGYDRTFIPFPTLQQGPGPTEV